jgi:hypothetical protein
MNHPNGPNGNCAKRYRTCGSGTKEKIAVHFRFKVPSCEVQQQWCRCGAAIQNPSPRTQTTQRKTRFLIHEERQCR